MRNDNICDHTRDLPASIQSMAWYLEWNLIQEEIAALTEVPSFEDSSNRRSTLCPSHTISGKTCNICACASSNDSAELNSGYSDNSAVHLCAASRRSDGSLDDCVVAFMKHSMALSNWVLLGVRLKLASSENISLCFFFRRVRYLTIDDYHTHEY